MLPSTNFTTKLLSQHRKMLIRNRFIFNSTQRTQIPLKNGHRDFQTFHLTLKQVFWKTKVFFKKQDYLFLVQLTTIENAIFPYKAACQMPMLRLMEWGVQNGPIKKWLFVNIYLFFGKFNFIIKTSNRQLIQGTNYLNVHIHIFLKRLSFTLGCVFPLNILKFYTLLHEY